VGSGPVGKEVPAAWELELVQVNIHMEIVALLHDSKY
jgi:hypothetical protein